MLLYQHVVESKSPKNNKKYVVCPRHNSRFGNGAYVYATKITPP
jgi:hypothetical protein